MMHKTPFILLILILTICASPKAAAAQNSDGSIVFDCEVTQSGGLLIKAESDEQLLECSTDGGKSFFTVPSRGLYMSSLPAGSYNVSLRKQKSENSRTDTVSVLIPGKRDGRGYSFTCTGTPEYAYKCGTLKVTLTDYDPEKAYLISLDHGGTYTRACGRDTLFEGLSGGYYDVVVKTIGSSERSPVLRAFVPYCPSKGMVNILAKPILQLPELPTGCEITSLAMALRFYGFNIDKTVLADYFLEKSEYRTSDFNSTFVGDPRSYNAYGCYSPVIVKCARRFLDGTKRHFDVNDLTGCDFEECLGYLNMGYPVIVWVTMGMAEPVENSAVWMNRDNGEIVRWVGNEHCVLLTGYDSHGHIAICCDPMKGRIGYDSRIFKQRFEQMGCQAIAIVETTDKG